MGNGKYDCRMKPGPDSFALLKNDLQKVVTCNFLANGTMTVDFTLSLIASYILKYHLAEVKSCPQLDSLAKTVNRICFSRKKVTIGQLSYSDSVRYVNGQMGKLGLQDKIQMLQSLDLKPILGIDCTGHISFRDGLSSTTITSIKGEPASKYTVENVNLSEEMSETTEPAKTIQTVKPAETVEAVKTVETAESAETETVSLSPGQKPEPSADSAVDNTESEVTGIPQTDGDGSSIDVFTGLYTKLAGKRPQNKYVWQWMLTKEEYANIKNTIKDNSIPKPSKWTEAIARVLELYIGEFYKREYDGKNNPFSILDGSHNTEFKNYKEICEKLGITPYKKENQVRQFTLYVSGGLPIYQITQKLDSEKTTTFIDGLSYLLGSENDTDETINIAVGEEKIASATNTALKNSYQQRESIYLYIQDLAQGKPTWNDSDNADNTFSSFKKKVTEANDKAKKRKKFRICYSMWTYLDADGKSIIEMSLTPEVRFNPEDEGARHYAISEYRANRWGIQNDSASFNLEIAGKKIPFTWCCNGDYISIGLIDRVSLAAIDLQSLSSDSLPAGHNSIRCTGQYLDDNEFSDGYRNGILQLYTDDDPLMASWVSFKGNRAFHWSALLFDRSRYLPVSEENFRIINDGSLGWIWFRDFCTLEDMQKQKTITIFNSKGNFYAHPADESIHPLSKNGAILPGSITCTIPESPECPNTSPPYIVKDKNIKFNLFKVSDDTAIDVPAETAYKRLSESDEWTTYDDHSKVLPQGFYEFRITFAGYSTVLRCFVLGDKANITLYSQGEQNYIKFSGISGITYQGKSGDITIQKETDCPIFRPGKRSLNSYKFRISDGNNYLEFSTYPPKAQAHILLNGKEIEEVIAAYADKCRVSIFSGKRSDCYTLGDRDKVYQSIFNKMTATASDKDTSLTGRIDMNSIDEDIVKNSLYLRLYTKDINENDGDNNGSLYFLDFKRNDVTEITGAEPPIAQAQRLAEEKGSDGLLFQSLKDNYSADFYCAPKYISYKKKNPERGQKVASRKNNLSEYATKAVFANEIAFKQFEIANTHKLYLAFSDPLLSMMWNAKKKDFIDKERDLFKKNLLDFLSGYVKNTVSPDIDGLIRLSREFMFSWKAIGKLIIEKADEKLRETYSKLTNE